MYKVVKRDCRILLIIPAYNEEGNIANLIETIRTQYSQYDYVVVNDGSSDGTKKILEENKINHINLPINLGIGGAVQMGYIYAKECGYDIAIQVDGDGQHDVRYVESLIEPIINGNANVTIGSRFIKKDGFQSSFMRRTGITILGVMIYLLCGERIKDVTSGFRAVDKKYISIYAEDYPYDYPEPEAIISAKMHGGVIKEIPVVMKERQAGISSINAKKSIYYMIKVTLALIICRISFGFRRAK